MEKTGIFSDFSGKNRYFDRENGVFNGENRNSAGKIGNL
jgi:hypothetical protein